MSLPNLISIARLMAVPVMIYLILNGYYLGAFWLFVAAGVSDAIDGYLAKALGQETVLGSYLDPLADKALLLSRWRARTSSLTNEENWRTTLEYETAGIKFR